MARKAEKKPGQNEITKKTMKLTKAEFDLWEDTKSLAFAKESGQLYLKDCMMRLFRLYLEDDKLRERVLNTEPVE